MARKSASSPNLGRLKAAGFNSYSAYLASDMWRETKRRFFKSKAPTKNEAGQFCCARCRATQSLQVHHRTYKSLLKEHINHLIILCGDCHVLVHEKHRAGGNNGLWYATKSMIKGHPN